MAAAAEVLTDERRRSLWKSTRFTTISDESDGARQTKNAYTLESDDSSKGKAFSVSKESKEVDERSRNVEP